VVRSVAPLVGPGPAPAGAGAAARPRGEASFQDALARAAAETDVRFSAHAQERMESRQINLTEDDRHRLGDAVDRASKKGAHQSLVLLDDLALIVSVSNRTVITAMNNEDARERAFTNIDSAVIA
jgi:flagellar operon protein